MKPTLKMGLRAFLRPPPQMRWRVKTPLSLSEMMGRGRNGVEGFADGPQDDREGRRGGEAPSKMMGRGRNGLKPTLK